MRREGIQFIVPWNIKPFVDKAMRCTSAAVKRYRMNETDGVVYTPVERETSCGRRATNDD